MIKVTVDDISFDVKRIADSSGKKHPYVGLMIGDDRPYDIKKIGDGIFVAGYPLFRRAKMDRPALVFNANSGGFFAIQDSTEYHMLVQGGSYHNAEKEMIQALTEHGHLKLTVDHKARLPITLTGDERELLVNHQLNKLKKRMDAKGRNFSVMIDTGNTNNDQTSFVVCIYGDWQNPKDGILKGTGRQIGALFNGPLVNRDMDWDRIPMWNDRVGNYDSRSYTMSVRPSLTVTQSVYNEMKSNPDLDMEL